MSSLDRLVIRGIRSFDNNSSAMVEFQTPVTVIVGANGTGKTTIIECLKYATTGELPPNTKGGAFVHDPKMAGEKEVKASVKLRFQNSNSERMVVTRNLSVSVKKTGLSMKTLEGILSKDEAGESNQKRNTISTKCSEIDDEVPLLLGVSRAILDNVIFCHQEESNWPLSEPATLKKKFDEIFEATKFTDALDSIKKIRKDRAADLKVEKEKLNHLKMEKDRSEILRTKLAKVTQYIKDKDQQAEDLGQKAQEMAVINISFRDQAEQFAETFNKQENLKHQISVWEEQIMNYEETMSLLQESEEELRGQLHGFDQTLADKKQLRTARLNRRGDEEDVLRALERDFANLAQKRGRLDAEFTAHQTALSTQENLAAKICTKFDIGYSDDTPLDQAKLDELKNTLQNLKREQERILKNKREETQAEEARMQTELINLNNVKAAESGSRNSFKSQIDELENQVRKDARGVTQTSSSVEAELSALQADIATQQTSLDEVELGLKTANYEETKRRIRGEINALDNRRNLMTDELSELQHHSATQTKLAIKKEGLMQKEAEAASITTENTEKFQRLVGKSIVQRTMIRDVVKALSDKDGEVADAERDRSKADRVFAQAEAAVQRDKDKLLDAKHELSDLKDKIDAAIQEVDGAEDLTSGIKICLEQIELARGDIAYAGQLPALFEMVEKSINSKHVCLGCNRSVDDRDMKTILAYVHKQKTRRSVEDSTEKYQEDLDGWTDQLGKLNELKEPERRIHALEDEELERLTEQIRESEKRREQTKSDLEKALASLESLREKETQLQELREVSNQLARLLEEISSLKQGVEELDRSLTASGSTRPVVDVEDDLQKANIDLKRLRQELQQISVDEDHLSKQGQGYRNQLNNLNLRLVTLEADLRQVQTVEKRLVTSREKIDDLRQQLADVDHKVAAADVPIQRLQEEFTKFRSSFTNELSTMEERLASLVQAIANLDQSSEAVEEWTASEGPRRLSDLNDQISRKEGDLKRSRTLITHHDEVIKQFESEIYQSDRSRKNIEDNIRHRQFKDRVRNAKIEIQGLGLEEASRARDQYARKYKKAKEQEQQLTSQHATLLGEISSLRAQALEMKDTLNTEYKNINPEFMSKLIEVKTSDLANIDLEKYGKALDSAIMRYHSVKMAEINDNIRYLWNRTYQGTDIDQILIRSDSEEPKTATTRKSYNYRVVMVKDQVEMDMRGRCSAGQKVLASIIIRLALSDSFGHNCGIIALDEPTTNLDKENIRSLAESLAQIIEERRSSGNFQLIVITHDEEFLREIAFADGIDYYMRVSRNAQQKSIVSKYKTSNLG